MKAKFVTWFLAVFCIIAGQALAVDVYIENHSFEEPGVNKTAGWDEEDGAFFHDPDDWTNLGAAEIPGWEADGYVEDSGVAPDGDAGVTGIDADWYGFIMGDDPTVYQLTDHTIMPGEVFTLTFNAYNCYDGPELQANLYYDNEGAREVVGFVRVYDLVYTAGEPVPASLTFIVDDAPAAAGNRIGIEFDNPRADDEFAWGTWSAFDDVHLDVSMSYVSLIYPPNRSTNIPRDAVLEWSLDEQYTCDVYFGIRGDPNVGLNPKVIEDEYATTYDPYGSGPEGLLEYDTTYYWRIDVIDPNEGAPITYTGTTWRFTTMTELVVILTEPESVTVPAGGTAEFSVEAASPTPISYTWYKVKKGGGGDTLVSTDEILTIEEVELADEGDYYCILENEKGTVTSAQARLMIQRMVGWWKLNGDAVDSVGDVVSGVTIHNGTLPAEPNFIVDGIDGQGYEFFGDGRVIVFAETGEDFNFHPQGMTVSLWLRTETEGWDGVVSKHLRGDSWVGWLIDLNGGDDEWGEIGAAHFTIRGSHEDLFGNDYDGAMNDGQWYLFTAVVDPDTETTRVYVNGAQKNESDTYDFSKIGMNDEPLVFGAEDQYGEVPFVGAIDDVRLWNYPLGTAEIANLYLEFVTDGDVCIDEYESWHAFDFAGGPGEPSFCRIDVEDIAEFLTAWMECSLVPACLP